MELREYVRVLHRRMRFVAVPVLVAVVAALALSLLGPRTYTSSTTLFFSPDGSASASSQDDQRLASFVTLVKSPRVASAVIDRLHLDENIKQVRDSLSAKTKPGTLLVEVTGTASAPRQARRVATVATTELVRLSGELQPRSSRTEAPGLRLAQAATPAEQRSSLWRDLALGLAVGLFLGVVLAFVSEGLDDRVTSPDQLLADHGLRTLATVRVQNDAYDARALLWERLAPEDGAYRRLRLALQLAGAPGPRTILVAACSPDAGATATVAGLGRTLAGSGLRVVIVCADPARAQGSGEPGALGVSDVLTGEANVQDALRPTVHESLRQLTPGRDFAYLDELLASDTMAKLLARLQGDADVVLVESPPMSDSVAAPLLAAATGAGVVLVVRQGQTRREQVGSAVQLVDRSGAPLLGAVVSRADPAPLLRPSVREAWRWLAVGRAVDLYSASAELPARRRPEGPAGP